MTYVLDACALIALLNREEGKGFETVRVVLYRAEAGKISVCMSIVNLVEVYYGYIQQYGAIEKADSIMRDIGALPIKVITTVSETAYREAARFKALYSMSLADAFLCATAKSLSASIVTKAKKEGQKQGKNYVFYPFCDANRRFDFASWLKFQYFFSL